MFTIAFESKQKQRYAHTQTGKHAGKRQFGLNAKIKATQSTF